jgi:gas vesicle protein
MSGPSPDRRGSRLRPFLLGGLVGGIVALAAGRLTARRGRARRPGPTGLAAFEEAPCYRETLEREQSGSRS